MTSDGTSMSPDLKFSPSGVVCHCQRGCLLLLFAAEAPLLCPCACVRACNPLMLCSRGKQRARQAAVEIDRQPRNTDRRPIHTHTRALRQVRPDQRKESTRNAQLG